MMDNVHEFVKTVLLPRVAFAVCVTALVLLVLPLPDFLQLDDSTSQIKNILRTAGIFSFILWLVSIGLMAADGIRTVCAAKRERKAVLAFLDTLSPYEKFVLARYLCWGHQTHRWHPEDTQTLVSKGLLEFIPSVERQQANPPFTMPRFVWDHLQANKSQFVEGAKTANPDRADKLVIG